VGSGEYPMTSSGDTDRAMASADDESDAGSVDPAGRFRIYVGAAPGVGKTFAMLNEGRRRKRRGADVAIGFVECHGRQTTEDVIGDLEVIRRRVVEYRSARFEEMDLTAVLERHPQVVLVDELAHTNVPGSGGNEKRWEDVVELLDAEVDVITTVNIQHLESLADAVERIIEVPIRERVPDWVVRKADQFELVDSSPEQLRRRMVHGNIYPPDRVPEALAHYFRIDNLTALRELALRYLADETEDQLLDYLRGQRRDVTWDTHERILVGVTSAPGTDAIVRRASRLASRVKGDLTVVAVLTGRATRRHSDDRLDALRALATDVGAEWHEVRGDDPARALIEFARQRHVTQVVVGSSGRSRWQELMGGGSTVRKIARLAATADVDVHIIARRDVDLDFTDPLEASGES
jgi:two-component system, OmpR family, sensor histidine kinase KdpD